MNNIDLVIQNIDLLSMSKKYWLDGRVVMQRPAKPFTPVRFRLQPPKIMKIGIIGYGFVGNALASSFNDSVDYRIVDPKKKYYYFFISRI